MATAHPPQKRSAGRPREFDREEALRIAMNLFWRFGYEGTTTPQLTAAMRISQPSLYAAFGSKEALYSEAVDYYRGKYSEFLTETLGANLSLKVAVEAMLIRAAKQFADRDSHPPGCMVATGALQSGAACMSIQDSLVKHRHEAKVLIRDRLEVGRKAGELPADADVSALASYFAMVIQGMAVQARDGASLSMLTKLAKLAMQAWPER